MKPIILIYGEPGAGKTTCAKALEDVFYIDTEGRVPTADITILQYSKKTITEAVKNSNKKRIVIDSIDALARHIESYAKSVSPNNNFGERYVLRSDEMNDLIYMLRAVDKTVVMTANITRDESTELNENGEVYKRITYSPALSTGKTGVLTILEKHCDVIGVLLREKILKSVRVDGQVRTVEKKTQKRIYTTSEDSGMLVTKDVLLGGVEMEMTPEKFSEYVKQLEDTINNGGKANA